MTRRNSTETVCTMANKCFFCDENSSDMRKASTFKLQENVQRCALVLQDSVLLAKLSAGDMMAQDAMYHPKCLVALYRTAEKVENTCDDKEYSGKQRHAISLAELLTYIEESREDNATAPIFKLSDLANMYTSRLKQLGVNNSTRTHSTRLKEPEYWPTFQTSGHMKRGETYSLPLKMILDLH